MYTPSTPLLPVMRMSTLPWFVLIAMVWCAALLDVPQFQHQPYAQSASPEFDTGNAVAPSDRNVSSRANDRRAELTSDGNPLALAPYIAVATTSIGLVVPTVLFHRRPATRLKRSPAQPRAPPAHAIPHVG